MANVIYAKEVKPYYSVGDELWLLNGDKVEFLAEISVKELRPSWHLGCDIPVITHNGLSGYGYRYKMYKVINSAGKIENIRTSEFNESISRWKSQARARVSRKEDRSETPELPWTSDIPQVMETGSNKGEDE
jgi:hypothetical protein